MMPEGEVTALVMVLLIGLGAGLSVAGVIAWYWDRQDRDKRGK